MAVVDVDCVTNPAENHSHDTAADKRPAEHVVAISFSVAELIPHLNESLSGGFRLVRILRVEELRTHGSDFLLVFLDGSRQRLLALADDFFVFSGALRFAASGSENCRVLAKSASDDGKIQFRAHRGRWNV